MSCFLSILTTAALFNGWYVDELIHLSNEVSWFSLARTTAHSLPRGRPERICRSKGFFARDTTGEMGLDRKIPYRITGKHDNPMYLALLSAVLSPDTCELVHPPLVSQPLSLLLQLRYTRTMERHMTPTNKRNMSNQGR
jgi:hypothetical protein